MTHPVCTPWPHLLQAAPAGLLNQLLRVHFFPDIVSHIQCCLLEELGEDIRTRSEDLKLALTKGNICNVLRLRMAVGFAYTQPLHFIIAPKERRLCLKQMDQCRQKTSRQREVTDFQYSIPYLWDREGDLSKNPGYQQQQQTKRLSRQRLSLLGERDSVILKTPRTTR